MLCPDVWKIPAPDYLYKENTGKFQNKGKTEIPKIFRDFHFTHMVSIAIPNLKHNPKVVSESFIFDFDYYKIKNVSLTTIVNKNFINNFIKIGKLSFLSIDNKIDIDNCVSLTSSGVLILSICRKTYQELGLEGKVSKFVSFRKDKYIIQLDLKSESFITHKNFYQRVCERLNKLQTFNIIISWIPPNLSVCPSSVAKYFSDKNYQVELCKQKTDFCCHDNLRMPNISSERDSAKEIVEWLGVLALGAIQTSYDDEGYISTYSCPDNYIFVRSVTYFQWQGFFTAEHVQIMYEKFVSYISPPWSSFYVQGFSDSVVSWGLEEQHFHTNGDNCMIMFLQPDNGEYLLCVKRTSRKKYRNKYM